MYSDKEVLKMLEKKVEERGLYSLTYDDRCLLDALNMTDVKSCPVCGSAVKHSIRSVCAGHGDFPRYLNIECQGCGLLYENCIDYGGSIQQVIDAFKRKARRVIKAVKDNA